MVKHLGSSKARVVLGDCKKCGHKCVAVDVKKSLCQACRDAAKK